MTRTFEPYPGELSETFAPDPDPPDINVEAWVPGTHREPPYLVAGEHVDWRDVNGIAERVLVLEDQTEGLVTGGDPGERFRFKLGDDHPTWDAANAVNVRDFNAIADGIGDDTATVQAAMNAASALGLPVYLPPTSGFYRLTGPLIPAAKQHIILTPGTIIEQTTKYTPVFDILDKDDVTIDGAGALLRYAGDRTWETRTSYRADAAYAYGTAVWSNSNRGTFRNLRITGFSVAVYLSGWNGSILQAYAHSANRVDNILVDTVDFGLLITGQDALIASGVRGRTIISPGSINPNHLLYCSHGARNRQITIRDFEEWSDPGSPTAWSFTIKGVDGGVFTNLSARGTAGVLTCGGATATPNPYNTDLTITNVVGREQQPQTGGGLIYMQGNDQRVSIDHVVLAAADGLDSDRAIRLDGIDCRLSDVTIRSRHSAIAGSYDVQMTGTRNTLDGVSILNLQDNGSDFTTGGWRGVSVLSTAVDCVVKPRVIRNVQIGVDLVAGCTNPVVDFSSAVIVPTTTGGLRPLGTTVASCRIIWATGAVRTITATTAASQFDDIILCDSTTAAFNFNLFPASETPGKRLTIYRIAGTNNVTIDGSGSELVGGSLTRVLTRIGSYVELYCDRGQWLIVAQDDAAMNQVFNVRAYGAKGDGVTSDTASIQAAIDAANAGVGGTVFFPPGSYRCVGLILKSGVVLQGQNRFRGSSATKYGVRLQANGDGIVIDTPAAAACDYAEINGIQIIGQGTPGPGNGIRFRDANFCAVKNVTVHGFNDEGILVDSTSIACVFEDILITQALLNRTRAAKSGAFDIAGTDHQCTRIEAGTSQSAITDANLYCCAILIRGAQMALDCCFGELSDVGVHLPTGGASSGNRISNCRADLNFGHGWEINGVSNVFATCYAMSNGQGTTNTYDSWQFTAASGNNLVTSCFATSVVANKPRYGFNDLASSAANKNYFSNCFSFAAITAQYGTTTSNGSGFGFVSGSMKTLTANSTTPDVGGYERWLTANSSGTTITDFVNGTQGQRLTIFCNDANTTIQHNGATIVLMNPGNLKLISGRFYEFVKNGGAWRDITIKEEQVGADVGNAAKSLQARVAETTQRWATPLTANRAVTLSTTGAYNGAKFRVVRTAAATGAFTLDVGTGPLKSLAVGQWADCEYDGAAWFLSAFGSL